MNYHFSFPFVRGDCIADSSNEQSVDVDFNAVDDLIIRSLRNDMDSTVYIRTVCRAHDLNDRRLDIADLFNISAAP